MKKQIRILLFCITIILLTSCSAENSKYKVYENITGTYGVEIESAKHTQDIEMTKEYTNKNAVIDKKANLHNSDYDLKYTHSEKNIKIPYDIDCYEHENSDSRKVEIEYVSGTDKVFSIFMGYRKHENEKFLTEDEIQASIATFLLNYSDYIDVSIYNKYSFYEYQQGEVLYKLYTARYYNEYEGIKLGDELYLGVNQYGEVFVMQNYFNNLKEKFTEMDLKINEEECVIELERKLDKIYGKDKYTYEISSSTLYMSPDDKPYLDYWIEVNAEGAFNMELCNLLLFIED